MPITSSRLSRIETGGDREISDSGSASTQHAAANSLDEAICDSSLSIDPTSRLAYESMVTLDPQQSRPCRDRETGPLLRRVFGCSPELADHIMERGRFRRYEMRVAIVSQGDRISTLYVIIAGRAHALVYSIDGQAILLHEYCAGDLFGVMSSPYSADNEADVIAVEAVSAFLLDGYVLALLAEQHACIGLALLKFMVDRLQQTSSRMYEQAALSAVGRVHAELLRQSRQASDLTIRPSPVVADLALRVATTRETASRAINALERRGIIRRETDGLVVVAPHRLEELIL